jgi:hypothetical protein
MTAPTTPTTSTARPAGALDGAAAEQRLRTVLRADVVVTAGFGLLAMAAPTDWFDAGWLPRAIGLVLVLVAVEVAVASRWIGARLRLAGLVTGELAAAWVVGSVVVLLLAGLPRTGALLLALSAAVTAGFAVAELAVVRRWHPAGRD